MAIVIIVRIAIELRINRYLSICTLMMYFTVNLRKILNSVESHNFLEFFSITSLYPTDNNAEIINSAITFIIDY